MGYVCVAERGRVCSCQRLVMGILLGVADGAVTLMVSAVNLYCARGHPCTGLPSWGTPG